MKKPYDEDLRLKLAKLSPDDYGARFAREEEAVLLLQRILRGHQARVYYYRYGPEKRRRLAEWRSRHEAAIRLQRQYRHFRSNAILRTNRKVRRVKARLAINLQRLFRAKKSKLVTAYKRRVNLHHRQVQDADRARAAVRIQRAWFRYIQEYTDGEQPDAASLLVKQLIRGHEKM